MKKRKLKRGQLLEVANQEAEEIRRNTRLEAEAIVTKARKEADSD